MFRRGIARRGGIADREAERKRITVPERVRQVEDFLEHGGLVLHLSSSRSFVLPPAGGSTDEKEQLDKYLVI